LKLEGKRREKKRKNEGEEGGVEEREGERAPPTLSY
jgi:hypothetical protein